MHPYEEAKMIEKDKAPTKEELSKDEQDKKDERDEELEHELEDSFPASDPPSMTQPNRSPGSPDHGNRPG